MSNRNLKLYNDIYKTELKFYDEVVRVCRTEEEKNENETRSFRVLAKIYSKLYKTNFHSIAVDAFKKIKMLDKKKIKGKYKVMYILLKINGGLFAKIFNIMYKKS
jgi:lysine/ornithine N-monooxygenase